MKGGSEATDALVATAATCWRSPAAATLTRRDGRGDNGRVRLAEFLVVPSAGRPRLLVPASAPAAAAESVRRYSHALTPGERVVRTVLALGLRSGLMDALSRDRLQVTASAQEREQVVSLQQRVGELLGRPVVFSLGVGTPRANRKPVLQALTPDGESLAYVKLGDTPLTRQLLTDEAAALGRLAERDLPGLVVPELLYHGEWEQLGVLVQSALPTPAWPRRRRGLPVSALRTLVDTFAAGSAPATALPFWQNVIADTDRITDPARLAVYTELVAAVRDRVGEQSVTSTAWHGDWAPWNMAWVSGEVRVWDWERFAEGVPAGFDPLHYLVQVRAGRVGWIPALEEIGSHARSAAQIAGQPADRAGPLALLYPLELARRYLIAAAPDSGTSLRPRTDQLLVHLARATGVAHPPVMPPWSSS